MKKFFKAESIIFIILILLYFLVTNGVIPFTMYLPMAIIVAIYFVTFRTFLSIKEFKQGKDRATSIISSVIVTITVILSFIVPLIGRDFRVSLILLALATLSTISLFKIAEMKKENILAFFLNLVLLIATYWQ